ncbi:hypothetical protein GCM10010508_38300 [Streptomyces naganishii JCM 4654]|uniref:histidine kinase n=1 Tax=Streptomyces naganishii JCM 4654 TaxID=1306179 RepID=A0A918Y5Y6_9ACTN|nr:hypothetical protein GCM10010508_38300 [Streptomyces naganishii JCM 4654]
MGAGHGGGGLSRLLFCLPDVLHGATGGDGDGDGPRRFRMAFTRLPVVGMPAPQAGLVLPLLWRRRAPAVAFGAVTAVFVLQWSLGAALRADVALFVALYSLPLHGRLRQLPWACAVTAGALGLVAARVSTAVSVWDALFFLLSTATAALALGLVIRIRRARLARLRDRAARLEIERDQRGRLAVAAERTRVAREMHDIVGHNLSVIITLADAGALRHRRSPGARKGSPAPHRRRRSPGPERTAPGTRCPARGGRPADRARTEPAARPHGHRRAVRRGTRRRPGGRLPYGR